MCDRKLETWCDIVVVGAGHAGWIYVLVYRWRFGYV